MKRIFLSLLLTLTLGFSANQKESQAAIGIATGGIALPIIGGLYIAAFGTLLGIDAHRLAHTTPETSSRYKTWLISNISFEAFAVLAGIVLLDNQTGDFQFAQLNEKNALSLHVSKKELATYNSEVDELNSIRENVALEMNGSNDVNKAKAIWESYANAVSPETLIVAQQIAGSTLR